ncbi:DUF998 domain-containing protein [Candidatus Bathyarchaeota archaeon]|nr:DUF998 domain-containing protein [Candidatus Bathyarchaeota archaeon]
MNLLINSIKVIFQDSDVDMKDRAYSVFGIIGSLLLYFSILISLILSPWFSWENNALSDLGHSVTSDAAAIFNMGLLLSGFLLMVYTATVFKKHAKYSSYCLLISTFFVQLVATFNETYGSIHFAVVVPHFIMLSLTSIVYTVERKSTFAFASFLIVMFSWLIYSLEIFNVGIAVPETISKIVVLWIMYSAIKIYKGENNF